MRTSAPCATPPPQQEPGWPARGLCGILRSVTRRRLYSSDYSKEARERLGAAVEATRRDMGYETRKQFALASKISTRSIEKIELAEPGVGPLVFDRLQRFFPTWTTETIRQILDGTAPPPKPMDVAFPTAIDQLLESTPNAAAVLEKLLRLYQASQKQGLTGDHLMAQVKKALNPH
jgi:hypothetical protein